MGHADLAAVLALPAAEQRRLLLEGDANERLWAAWAVALTLGADAVPLLRDVDALRAPSGLRRQVLVVMAGLGEREVLRTIAESDAMPDVRATACALFLRTAATSDADALAFAELQVRSPIGDVREAVLLEHEAGRVVLPDVSLFGALLDDVPNIRALALRCVALAGPGPPSDASLAAIIDAVKVEPDLDHRRALFDALPRASYRAVLHAVCDAAPRDLTFVLGLMGENKAALEWVEMATLERRHEPELLVSVLQLVRQPLEAETVRWLGQVVGRLAPDDGAPISGPAGEAWHFAYRLLMGALTPRTAAILDAATAEVLRRALEHELEACATWLERQPEDHEWVSSEIAECRRQLAILES